MVPDYREVFLQEIFKLHVAIYHDHSNYMVKLICHLLLPTPFQNFEPFEKDPGKKATERNVLMHVFLSNSRRESYVSMRFTQFHLANESFVLILKSMDTRLFDDLFTPT